MHSQLHDSREEVRVKFILHRTGAQIQFLIPSTHLVPIFPEIIYETFAPAHR